MSAIADDIKMVFDSIFDQAKRLLPTIGEAGQAGKKGSMAAIYSQL